MLRAHLFTKEWLSPQAVLSVNYDNFGRGQWMVELVMLSTHPTLTGAFGPVPTGWRCARGTFLHAYVQHCLKSHFCGWKIFIKETIATLLNLLEQPFTICYVHSGMQLFLFPPIKFGITIQLFYSIWKGLYERYIHKALNGISHSVWRCTLYCPRPILDVGSENEIALLQFPC